MDVVAVRYYRALLQGVATVCCHSVLPQCVATVCCQRELPHEGAWDELGEVSGVSIRTCWVTD
jgi:hypothetical protein